mgnify:CR=1 FL=1|jgi:glycosyltransferase involved in cell wall biosynthesis
MYNAGVGVQATLQSIASQTIQDFEIIIVDDGSTDNSVAIAHKKSPQAKIIHQKNTGISGALNHGLSHCKGKYIARIDCLDLALPKRLENQLDELESNPNLGVVGGHIILYENNIDIGLCKYPLRADEIELEILSGNCPVPHSGATLRSSVFKKTGVYDLFYNGREDFELWTRISLEAEITNVNTPIMRILSTRSGISYDGGRLSPLVALALIERQSRRKKGCLWKDEKLRSDFKITSRRNETSMSNNKQLNALFYTKRAGFLLKSGNKKAALQEFFNAIKHNRTHKKAWIGIMRALLIPHKIDRLLILYYKKITYKISFKKYSKK